MDGEAPTKPREQKVTNQRAGWAPLLLTLCLLQAANALKGPRLVSGQVGGEVTIRCHYHPTPINRHQRKYWCRLGPPTWICHTIVSSDPYTDLHYHGRVALTDFPRDGVFAVRLSRLFPEDVGYYRCGIGNRNDMLFFSMTLTISAGPSSIIPTATLATEELATRSFGTSPMANRWIPGATQTIEGQGTGWDRVALTSETSKMTDPTKGGQTSGTMGAIFLGTGSWVKGSIRATVPIPETQQALKSRGMSNATEGVWVWGNKNSVANRARESKGGRKIATTKADRQREETKRVRIDLVGAWTVIGTIKPSTLVSEKWAWENFQEATPVSRQRALGSIETTPAPGMWTLETTSTETASAEGSTEGHPAVAAGDSGPQATPSQALAAGPQRPPGRGSSLESSSPEEKSLAGILTPVSAVLVLFVLVALFLLQKKLWRRRT
ncbi:high affinity immunoglobulin alpha and immunoglobulin mu Fc receptor isoform X2 [Choloepus didactylus]|nr:high affinity immunoglobulin alpha and immunoglobulin mu Fc receptor isoform X2 [Choloepus didactylus]